MMEDDPGAWIFVSHSHHDIKEVRRVRDYLEAKGHNPLLFFLKSLNDHSELDDLIRREIKARNFFLLCDSPNAKSSRWVQNEVEFIKSIGGKVYRSIDLGAPWQSQLDAIDDLSRHATLFMSYARSDQPYADRVAEHFRALDYRVLLDTKGIVPGERWKEALEDMIDTALATGIVAILLSPETFRSSWVRYELSYAYQRSEPGDGNIRLFIIRDREAVLRTLSDPELAPLTATTQVEDLTHLAP
jgi:hypothetical protein